MSLLDRLLGHDHWTTRRLLDVVCELPERALDQEFDLGKRTLRATFEHVIRNIEVWTDAMQGNSLRTADGDLIDDLRRRLERAYEDFAALARDIERRDAWDERWLDSLDDPPREKTFGGAIAHVITHDMHHRAQLLFMLRRLGAETPEGDILSWENEAAREN